MDDILAVIDADEINNTTRRRDTTDLLVDPNLDIIQDVYPGCGGRIWEAGTVLSQYVAYKHAQNPSFLRGKRVIELGAGTGIVSLAAWKAVQHLDQNNYPTSREEGGSEGASIEVLCMTDLPCLTDLMERNVISNGFQNDLESGRIRVLPLNWSEPLSEEVGECSPFDIVFVADCIYLEQCFEPLLQTLDAVMTSKTICYMAYKRRRRAEKRFFTLLRKSFYIDEVQDDPHWRTYSRMRLYIFKIQKKDNQLCGK